MAKRPGAGGIILLAVVLGLVTAYLIWNYFQKQQELSVHNWEPVVVAAVDIRPNTRLTREMLRIERYPKELIADNTITRLEDAVDRVTQNPINNKAQVRHSDLLAPGQAPKLSIRVPDGMRAVAIAASEVAAVGYSVQPGDRIDLIATYNDPKTKQDLTKIILQNVLVLAVNEGITDPQGKTGARTSMTLAVRPEQTELVKAAERSGSLSVALRGRDEDIVPTEGVSPKEFTSAPPVDMPTSVMPRETATATPIIFLKPDAGSARNVRDVEVKIIRGSDEKTVVLDKP
jgi:pilus assembly protein CpaB